MQEIRWQVCLNVNETDTFYSTENKKTCKINHKFDCSDTYLSICRKCLIQYVGKTVDEFQWNNYKNYSWNHDCNQPCMQRHSYEHYSSVGPCGFLEHVSITLTDKTDSSNLLKRQDYSNRTLCTMAPYCLNIENHVWSIPLWLYKFFFCGRLLPHYVFMTKNI